MTRRRDKKRKSNESKQRRSYTPKILTPKNEEQQIYMNSIMDYDMTICSAIAGTGKTYVGVGMACRYLLDEKIDKIVIFKPNISCGPDLGHLPGDVNSKISPFMDHFNETLDIFLTPDRRKEFASAKMITYAPLQTLRGASIDNAILILDEMQNATYKQLKMIATRPGDNSKVIMLGDMTQSDLNEHNTNEIQTKFFDNLRDSEFVNFVELNKRKVVRSRLAREIANRCP